MNKIKFPNTRRDNETDYDNKDYIRVKINSDDDLLLNKSFFLINVDWLN